MTGNMLDRNLIFPTCDYKQISKILPELIAKTVEFSPLTIRYTATVWGYTPLNT